MVRYLLLTLVCLLATVSAETREGQRVEPHRWRGVDHHSTTTVLRRVETSTTRPRDFRSSPQDLGPPPRDAVVDGSARDERRLEKPSTGTSPAFSDDNSLPDALQSDSAGDGKETTTKRKKPDDDEDEDKKTLSQQIADGKYGLIQKEIYSRPSLRPGIISYRGNPEVPRDTDKNLGGLEAEEIWLAEDHVLVLRGGWFPNHSFNKTETGPVWPPIDDYNAPPRQVKIPARPKVPPPFPIQLTEGGPTEFIGPNGTKSQYPFPPPFAPSQGNYPPGAGFYPPPGNGSLYPPLPPPYPFPPPRNGSFPPPPGSYPPGNFPPTGNYPPPPGRFPPQPPKNYPYRPGNEQYPPYPYPPPPHGYMPFPNGSSPFGPLPPFLPPLPPGAAFLPPPGNQTDFDDDDPSIYYPPPYDFYYPRDNATEVPPGPLVPGIILPPPPDFFAPLDGDKSRRPPLRPTTTPLPQVPYGSYLPESQPAPRPHSTPPPPYGSYLPETQPAPRPQSKPSPPYGSYLPETQPALRPHSTPPPPYDSYLPVDSPSPKPNLIDHSTPFPPYGSYRPSASPAPRPQPQPDVAYIDISTPIPPTPAPERPTVKRPYLTYVPVTTAVRKKKPRPPSTTAGDQYDPRRPVEFTTSPAPEFGARPSPPHFGRPQSVQVYHKGESPITSRPFYHDVDNGVTTEVPDYVPDGLSKLKDILYTTPPPTISYQLGTVIDIDNGEKTAHKEQPQYVTTLAPVKNIESTTASPPSNQYYADLTKRPIYVKEVVDRPRPTEKYPASNYETNSVAPVVPQRNRGNKGVPTPPPQQYTPYKAPQRSPKTTYYFYEEPHFEQGYVRDITTRKPYSQPQYESQPNYNYNYNNNNNNNNNNYQTIPRPQSAEELLLAQIVETFRQPAGYNIYNPQTNQNVRPQNYFSSGGNGQNFYPSPRPNAGLVYSTPRPGYYVTRKPDYYTIQQSESPLQYNYNNYNNQQPSLLRGYPYNYEDVVQSTEHPLPQRFNSAARPVGVVASPAHLVGPDGNVQTSPKTIYEYSFQKQADASNTFPSRPTERPVPAVHNVGFTQKPFHSLIVQQKLRSQQKLLSTPQKPQPQQQQQQIQQSTNPINIRQSLPPRPTHVPLPANSVDEQYYDQITPTVKPKPYRPSTPRPQQYHHQLPAVQSATPDPLQHFYTQQDATLLDDITKKYFTIFGQKIPAGGGDGGHTARVGQYDGGIANTTPLPPSAGSTRGRYTTHSQRDNSHHRVNQRPGSHGDYASADNAPIPLHDDILVNYLHPRPTINPDSEFVDTNVHQNVDGSPNYEEDDSKGGELVSYNLPGNGGGHVYFVTPQVASSSQERDVANDGYSYSVPARRLRTRSNKTKQS